MYIDKNETQEGRDAKLNALDQVLTRERLTYTPGAHDSASESPRARAPETKEKRGKMKTLTSRPSLPEFAHHAPEKMILNSKREAGLETIDRYIYMYIL
jgi:hypothetical protein